MPNLEALALICTLILEGSLILGGDGFGVIPQNNNQVNDTTASSKREFVDPASDDQTRQSVSCKSQPEIPQMVPSKSPSARRPLLYQMSPQSSRTIPKHHLPVKVEKIKWSLSEGTYQSGDKVRVNRSRSKLIINLQTFRLSLGSLPGQGTDQSNKP